jgi:hypothetical protein
MYLPNLTFAEMLNAADKKWAHDICYREEGIGSIVLRNSIGDPYTSKGHFVL